MCIYIYMIVICIAGHISIQCSTTKKENINMYKIMQVCKNLHNH